MCCGPTFLKSAVLFANLHEYQIQNSLFVMLCDGIVTDIQTVSGKIVNILAGGSMDYSE
jgi:N-methylhydantoinase A/oxoprolinase/acetone carboxylase beta subunit